MMSANYQVKTIFIIVLYIVAMGALTPSSVGALYIRVYHNMYDATLLLIIFYHFYLGYQSCDVGFVNHFCL